MLFRYLFHFFNLLFFFPLLVSKYSGLIIVNLLLFFHFCYIFRRLKDFYSLNLYKRKKLRPIIFFTNQIEIFILLIFLLFFLKDYI